MAGRKPALSEHLVPALKLFERQSPPKGDDMPVHNQKKVTVDSAIFKLLVSKVDTASMVKEVSNVIKVLWAFVAFMTIVTVFIDQKIVPVYPDFSFFLILATLVTLISGFITLWLQWSRKRHMLNFQLYKIQSWAKEIDKMLKEDRPTGLVDVYETTDVTNIKSATFSLLIELSRKILLLQKYEELVPSIQPPDFRKVVERMLTDQLSSYEEKFKSRYDRLKELGLIEKETTYKQIFDAARRLYWPNFT